MRRVFIATEQHLAQTAVKQGSKKGDLHIRHLAPCLHLHQYTKLVRPDNQDQLFLYILLLKEKAIKCLIWPSEFFCFILIAFLLVFEHIAMILSDISQVR